MNLPNRVSLTLHKNKWFATTVADYPAVQQLRKEAGIKTLGIRFAEIDLIIAAASAHGIEVETLTPENLDTENMPEPHLPTSILTNARAQISQQAAQTAREFADSLRANKAIPKTVAEAEEITE